MSDDFTFDLETLNTAFRDFVPHNRALGTSIVSATIEPAVIVMRLPYDERFVGNPETGVVHGGVITTALDATSGASVYLKLKAPVPIATLDLRVDFLKPATPRRDIFLRAECFRTTHNVGFVRATAYHVESDPIAVSTGTFMISTKGGAVTDMPAPPVKASP